MSIYLPCVQLFGGVSYCLVVDGSHCGVVDGSHCAIVDGSYCGVVDGSYCGVVDGTGRSGIKLFLFYLMLAEVD